MAERVLDPQKRKKLTFCQAEGLEAVPGPLKFLELDHNLRHEIWDTVFTFLLNHIHQPSYGSSYLIGPGQTLITQIYRYVFKHPLDEAMQRAADCNLALSEAKEMILNGKPSIILEAIQITLRSENLPSKLKSDLTRIISSERTSYSVIDDTIVPLASPEERDDVAQNVLEIVSSPLTGAYAHLKKAGADLSSGYHRDAIREAIHAVESAAIYVTGRQKAALGDALDLIQKTSPMHSTMKTAFEKLYAYTNAEKGIRHALLESENERVGREEALFMFSACTAFVGYLVRKQLSVARPAKS